MRYGKVIMILRFPIQIQKAGEVGFDCNLILLQLVLIGIVIQRPCSLGRDVPGLTLWYHYPGYKQDIIFLGKERRIVVILEPLDMQNITEPSGIRSEHLHEGLQKYKFEGSGGEQFYGITHFQAAQTNVSRIKFVLGK